MLLGDLCTRACAFCDVTTGKPTGIEWQDKLFDLRIEDHAEPVSEMKRLVRVARAYRHANQGDLYLEEGKVDSALIEYDLAAAHYPENPELPFWTAVSLAGVSRLAEALPIFSEVFERNPDLRSLVPRLVPAGLLPDNAELIEEIKRQ